MLPAVGAAVVLLAASSSVAQGQAPAETLHTVFTTECTPYFNWQSLGLLYSHRRCCVCLMLIHAACSPRVC